MILAEFKDFRELRELYRASTTKKLYLQLWSIDTLMAFPAGAQISPPLLSFESGMPVWERASNDNTIPRVWLSAHASPLREGLYTIWVGRVRGATVGIQKYNLSLLESPTLALRLKASQGYRLWSGDAHSLFNNQFEGDYWISYAGHASAVTWLSKTHNILPLGSHISYSSTQTLVALHTTGSRGLDKWRMV